MKLKVAEKNEYPFYPDIDFEHEGKTINNKDFPIADRFCIITKKINTSIHYADLTRQREDGTTATDMAKRLRFSIVRLVNPFKISQPDGKEIELTVDMLLSDVYKELFPIVTEFMIFVSKLEFEDADRKKKS